MKLSKKLKEIEKDCLDLKRRKDLTEYGKGQLDLIEIIKQDKEVVKYSVNDVKKYPDKSRLTIVGLMIANELNKMNFNLEEIRKSHSSSLK